MAKIKGNHLMKNVRGIIGKQVVYKERLGTPYVAAAPDLMKTGLRQTKNRVTATGLAKQLSFENKL